MANHARVLPIEDRRGVVLLGVVERYPLRQVRVRRGWRAQEGQCRPQGTVGRHEHCGVLGLLRQGQELLAQGVRRLQLGVHEIIIPQATQRWETLLGVFQVLTEVPGAGVGLFHLRRRVAFGGNQRRPQGNVQRQFLLAALRRGG